MRKNRENAKKGLGMNNTIRPEETLDFELNKLQKLQNDIVAWSTSTFGDRQFTAIPVIEHLGKEADELIDAINNKGNYKEEFADCFMLLIEAAKICGILTNELIDLTYAKLEVNKKRKWGKPDEKGIIEHVTDGQS